MGMHASAVSLALKTLTSPQALEPTRAPQQSGDPAITVSTKLPGQLDHVMEGLIDRLIYALNPQIPLVWADIRHFLGFRNVSAVAVLLWGCTEFKLIAFAETRGCLKPACQSDFRKGHVSLFDQLTRSI